MTTNFLDEIVAYKKSLLKSRKSIMGTLKKNIDQSQLTRYRLFRKAISQTGKMCLIAEIKKASPSQGLIRSQFDVLSLARTYVEHGADAISVLTENKYFLGKPEYLRMVSENFEVPVLRKDFIIDELQIYEAFSLGASAILLIATILDDTQIKNYIQIANQMDMDCLVEVHDEAELTRSLHAGAEIVGINNRNLRTFEVDLRTSERLIPQIPKDKVVVAESGIQSHEEVVRLRELGAHAVLIGETFLRAEDVGSKVREVMEGKP